MRVPMPSEGAAAEAARADVRALITEKGHAVDVARRILDRIDRAVAEGALRPTPFLDRAMGDLRAAVDFGPNDKLGGKSAEAARMILRAIARELDRA